jgi:ABC-type branched-subunit amino acid transport system ATPase component
MSNPLRDLDVGIARLEAQRELAESAIALNQSLVEHGDTEVSEIAQTLDHLRALEDTWRENFRKTLEAVVSQGLSSVMGRETQILLTSSTFRDVTSLDMMIKQGSLVTPIKGHGGSLIQVLAMLLEVLMTISVQPPLALTLILDEPFGMVSQHYRAAVSALITQLHEQLGIQFIIVTQEPDYLDCAHIAYEVHCEDGPARVKVLQCKDESAVL